MERAHGGGLGHEHNVAAVLHPLVRLVRGRGRGRGRGRVGVRVRARVRVGVASVRVRVGIRARLTAGVCISLRSTRSKLPQSTLRLEGQTAVESAVESAALEAARSSTRGSGWAPRGPASPWGY